MPKESPHLPSLEYSEPELKAKASVFQILLPIVVTGGIFWWILSGINFHALQMAMAGISWIEVSLVIGGFCLWMFIGDVFSFGAGFKFIVDPRAPWSHMFMIRSGTIFSGVIFPPLGELFAPYYFYRKWNKSVLRTVGTSLYVVLVDSSCGAIALACAFLFFDTSMLSKWWLLLLLGHASLLIGVSLVFSRWGLPWLPESFKKREFFYAMSTVTFSFTMILLAVRLAVFLGVCITLYYLLELMGIRLSAAQALLFMPLFMASVFLPISAGGYGGPQGAAVLFLVELWSLCSIEQALGFSLLWSTLFLMGRAMVSGIFILPLWKMFQALKPETSKA